MNRRAAPPPIAPLAACTLRVVPGATHIRLIPAGEFSAPRGALAGAGPWHLTPSAAARIVTQNRSRQADILIDYEHQTLLAADNGKPAPAAGWIDPRSLEYRADGDEPGLYGAVRWVGDAGPLIAAEQYRYLSPVFAYDAASGEPLDLLHVALTNFPAIDEPVRAALSARTHRTDLTPSPAKEPLVDMLAKLLTALGLPEGTSENDVVTGVTALKAKADAADGQIAALTARVAAAPPIEAAQAMQAEIAALKTQVADLKRISAHALEDAERKALIAAATADGRLHDTLVEWAAVTPLDALKGFLAAAPKIAALAGMQTGGVAPAGAPGSAAATASELAICRALGLTEEQFAKGKLEKQEAN